MNDRLLLLKIPLVAHSLSVKAHICVATVAALSKHMNVLSADKVRDNFL